MNARPWPVVLLTALGAWLAAIPFFAVAALLLGKILNQPEEALTMGLLMLGGSVALLRAPHHSLFVENLGVPVLLAGLGLVAWGLNKPLEWQGACGALSLVSLGLALALPQTWIRALLGAIAAQLALLALSPDVWLRGERSWLSPWVTMHLLVGLWLGSIALEQVQSSDAPSRRAIADTGHGWVASMLLAQAAWSGSTFLLSEPLSLGHPSQTNRSLAWFAYEGIDLGSSMAALLAMLGLAWRWPGLRRAWCAGLAWVACALSAFMPALGGVLLVASACLITDRRRMAVWAAVSALWVVGAFYYQLRWPLATKAGVLVITGMTLALLAAWGRRDTASRQTSTMQAHAQRPPRHLAPARTWSLGLGTLAALLVANGAIWKHESLIRNGRPVFVALAPVDPRSLMQGDYMALRFATGDLFVQNDAQGSDGAPLRLVFKVDRQGIATAIRPHQGEALAPGELIIQMTRKQGRWMLVTDAFYFKEGEGQRWAQARYGELRVDATGRALLVGLRDEQLAPMNP